MNQNSAKETVGSSRGEARVDVKSAFDRPTIKKAQSVLRALNHPVRKEMLQLIERQPEMMVTHIYEQMNIRQSDCSQHLAVLRKANIIGRKKVGKKVHYSINWVCLEGVLGMTNEIAKICS